MRSLSALGLRADLGAAGCSRAVLSIHYLYGGESEGDPEYPVEQYTAVGACGSGGRSRHFETPG